MIQRTFLTLLLAVAVIPVRAQDWAASSRLPTPYEDPVPLDPMKVTVHRLPNGLTVYLSPNSQEPRITAWIAVRAGSKHDPDDATGMAHYLEHMLFKGTRRLGTTDYAAEKPHLEKIDALYERLHGAKDPAERSRIYKEIDKENIEASRYAIPNEIDKAYKTLGIRGVNAFTSSERTVYVCNLPKNRLEAWARLESERFPDAVFRLFQSELEAVYEEMNQFFHDDPERALDHALDGRLFGPHPYGRAIIGTVDDLKNPSLAKMYEFHDRYYAPNNMAIVLAGDFDRKQALEVIGKYFGGWKPRPLPSPDRGAPAALKGLERASVRFEAEEKAIIAWPTVPDNHPDADALKVMDMVMDNAESGIINLYLNQGQRVKQAGSFPAFLNEAGVWHVWGSPKEGQTLEQVEALLMETVAKLKAGEFSEEDLKAIITNFEIAEKSRLESNDARVADMADAFASYEEWPHRVASLERLRKVTKADVLRVAGKYLVQARAVAYRRKGKPELPSIKKPEFTKIPIDASRRSPVFNEIVSMPAEPIEPRWLKEGRDYSVKKIRTGELFAAKNPMNDLFQLSFVFERGREHERRLCAALGLLDLAGAGGMSAEDFKRKLYSLGTGMSVSCGEKESAVSLSGLEANLEESLRLMKLRFDEPHIASGTLTRMVEILIGAHKDNKVDPDAIAGALSEYAQFGPRSSVLSDLTDAELKALDERELVAVMRSFFDYRRRVAYVGTREPGKLEASIDVGPREIKPGPRYEHKRYRHPGEPEIYFTHRDMVQSQVSAFAADEVYDPEHAVDYQFYGAYMGGGMSSVFFQEIREARSLAYAVGGGYYPAGRKGGENRVSGGLDCQADKTVDAVTLLLGLIREMPASPDRFGETSRSLEQAYRTNPVRFRDIPATAMRWQDLGIPEDPRPKRMKKVLKYRLEDLTGFAARFRNRPMTVSILGSRDRIDLKSLGALAPITEKKVDDLFPY